MECGYHVLPSSPPPPWHNMVPTPHIEVRNMSAQFRVPPPPHGITRYPHPIWSSQTCQSSLACPIAKPPMPPPPHGKARYPHPVWRSETCHVNFACPFPPMAKHGNHTPYAGREHVTPYRGQKHVNLLSRAPSTPMAISGTHTPYEGHKHVMSILRAPAWQNKVPTPHMKVRNMSIQFRGPPHGQTRYPHPYGGQKHVNSISRVPRMA